MTLPSKNIQETLFVPLWGRAYAVRNFPYLLNDRESVRIVKETGYDFSRIEDSREYFNLASAVRAVNFDNEIKEYLTEHPEATVVSIGSGLDTTFFRVDNGKITWYDLDLPEIISLRNEYISDHERVRVISQSCFEYNWMEMIPYNGRKGLVFVAGGLFYYFEEKKVRDFIKTLAEKFPGASLVFDAVSRAGLKISNRYVEKSGNKNAKMYFSFNNPYKYFGVEFPNIRIAAEYPFYSRIKIDDNWERETKFRMKFSDRFRMVKLVRLEFI